MSIKAFKKKMKSHTEVWEKARSAKKGKNEFIEVGVGRYKARLKELEVGVDKNNNPYVQFNTIVCQGPEEGSSVKKRHELSEYKGKNKKGESFTISMEDRLEKLSMDLQSMSRFDDEGNSHPLDMTEIDIFEDIEELADEFAETNPAFNISVTEKGGFKSVWFNDPLKDDAIPTLEEVLDDEEVEDEELEDEGEEEDEDEE